MGNRQTSKGKAQGVLISGAEKRALECIVCKNDTFILRKNLMNTAPFSALGLDWMNKSPKCYICESCGFVHWFV